MPPLKERLGVSLLADGRQLAVSLAQAILELGASQRQHRRGLRQHRVIYSVFWISTSGYLQDIYSVYRISTGYLHLVIYSVYRISAGYLHLVIYSVYRISARYLYLVIYSIYRISTESTGYLPAASRSALTSSWPPSGPCWRAPAGTRCTAPAAPAASARCSPWPRRSCSRPSLKMVKINQIANIESLRIYAKPTACQL